MTSTAGPAGRMVRYTLTTIGVGIGVAVAVLTNDVILGVIVAAVFVAIAVLLVRLWTSAEPQRPPRS